MPHTPRTSGEFLLKALRACATNGSLRRRIEDGRLHEDMILAGAAIMAEAAGCRVRMLYQNSSNYPLDMRYDPQQKPADYRMRHRMFLDVEGHLLRLHARPSDRRAGWELNTMSFKSQKAAERAIQDEMPHVAWHEVEAGDWVNETQGLDEMCVCAGLNQADATHALRALAQANTLDAAMPVAKTRRPTGRL